VQRVHASELSTADFVERFEARKRPVIVEGLLDEWPARTAWQPGELLRRFADVRFKVGSDDEGYPVRMKFKHYLSYLLHPQHRDDDSPLYIFDGTFADAKCAPELGKARFRSSALALPTHA
jgi:histone arginine demethylase JMJD6